MKSKLFLKASSLVCALALLVTGIHTAFAADRDYTLKKAFTIENAASANAVKLYEVRNNALAGTGNVTVEGSSVKYTATQDYVSFLGALTELDGVDLTASDVEIDGLTKSLAQYLLTSQTIPFSLVILTVGPRLVRR